MSDYVIEYCPWCSHEATQTTVQDGHTAHMAYQCQADDCGRTFRVATRSQETVWTNV